MNIFVTSADPVACASYLDDKRVVKMILESCQLLCTTLNLKGIDSPYKSTHVNHPCSIWTRNSRQNYEWLLSHMEALCNEYTFRYNKTHKCNSYLGMLYDNREVLNASGLSEFVNCTPYKDMQVFEAYKKTLTEKWTNDKRPPTWNRSRACTWFSSLEMNL